MKWLTMAAAALLLTGCSLLGMGYNHLHTLVYWRLDGMFDLTDTQTRWVRSALDDLHAWHRREQLPAYAQTLRRWAQLAPSDTTADVACQQFDSLRPGLDQLVQQALPALARLAGELAPQQRLHLQRYHQKQDAGFLEDYGDDRPGVVSPKRLQRTVERAEWLYGTLTPAQEALLEQGLVRGTFDARRTLQERQRRQADMLDAIDRIQAGAPPLPTVQAVWTRYQASPTPGYGSYAAATQRQACELFAALHNSTSPTQRARAAKTLLGYADDVAQLSLKTP